MPGQKNHLKVSCKIFPACCLINKWITGCYLIYFNQLDEFINGGVENKEEW